MRKQINPKLLELIEEVFGDVDDQSIVFADKPSNKRFEDIEGKTFKKLFVLGFAGRIHNRSKWWIKCECGNIKMCNANDIKRMKSCGCEDIDRKIKHGHKRKEFIHLTYKRWRSMMDRCYNTKHTYFQHYGGRGIIVCDKWKEYINFYNDMGDCPEKYTLDRIDTDGSYCKENCRWVDMKTQCNNRRNNRWITYNDGLKTLSQWAEFLNIKFDVLRMRLDRYKWSIEKAFTTPCIPKIRN